MPVDELTVEGFMELFEGRDDAVLVDPPRQVKASGSVEVYEFLEKHLNEQENIGLYPITPDSECRWICSDLDGGDSESEAWDLYAAWEFYGIQAWVETSRSKGHHVWVFLEEPISAMMARRAGLWIHAVAKVDPKELNPKQEILGEGEYGNCVRLPYPHKQHGTYRQCMWCNDRTTPMTVERFVEQALATRAQVNEVARLAALWTPPVIVSESRREPVDREHWDGSASFFAKEVFMDETVMVPEGGRDNTFWVLACYMRAREFQRAEALEYMTEIWRNQCDQSKSPYPLQNALEKVTRAYGGKVRGSGAARPRSSSQPSPSSHSSGLPSQPQGLMVDSPTRNVPTWAIVSQATTTPSTPGTDSMGPTNSHKEHGIG